MEPTFRGPLLAASTAVVKEAPLLSLLLASAIPCLQLSNSHASCVTNSLTPTQKKKQFCRIFLSTQAGLGTIAVPLGLWRNGSASDSRSEGWEFESLWPHILLTGFV